MISILSDWVSFLAYPNLFGIKGFVVVVVVDDDEGNYHIIQR
jgi:translation elongation factor EF-1beta